MSSLSSIFDPLGMVGPVLLLAKRVLRKTWQLKLHWDEKIPEDLLKDWNKWKLLEATFQLHHFSDASEVGYGTVLEKRN